jgi:hypothetical protein
MAHITLPLHIVTLFPGLITWDDGAFKEGGKVI